MTANKRLLPEMYSEYSKGMSVSPKEVEAAFIELWGFIESVDADALTENDMKCALIVLGEAARLPDHLVHGVAGDKEELEAMFYAKNKCGGSSVPPASKRRRDVYG